MIGEVFEMHRWILTAGKGNGIWEWGFWILDLRFWIDPRVIHSVTDHEPPASRANCDLREKRTAGATPQISKMLQY